VSTITTFGSVSIETSPTSASVVTKTTKATKAQLMSVIQYPCVMSNDIKLTLPTTFNIPRGEDDIGIRGCMVCPNGKMVFVDNSYNNKLVIFNDDGTLDKETRCSMTYPFDVTCLDDTTVAVSTDNGIEILNIDSKTTIRHIKTSEPCFGIAHHNGVLLWCEYQRGIQMMKLSDDRVTTLVEQFKLPYFSYIATCGDNIYQANYNTSTVTCYTMKREKLWEYKDVLALKDPWGVTVVDNTYNVNVTSYTCNSVVVLEPGGKQGRQLISSDDGLDGPSVLHFDKSKASLLVTNYHGPAFMYDMCSIMCWC